MGTVDAICIIGAKGMLGQELVLASRDCRLNLRGGLYALDRDEIDISDADSVSEVLGRLQPRLVINAAGYTDVDGCESHADLAEAVNARGSGNLAVACRANGGRLVHVSTDYVFDGCKRSPYLPGDAVHPLSTYGRTKADGERYVREVLDDHIIVRTSWLFGVHGSNFVKTILRLAEERDELRVVIDQIGCPTYASDAAETLLTLGGGDLRGTYHYCNSGPCSWNEFAAEIVRLAGRETRVLPMTTVELGRPAMRPAYSVLGTEDLTDATGIRPRHWREAVAECIEALRQVAGR